MTGTADTEAAEFDKIYKLEVVAIPTNRPMIRIELPGRGLPHRARRSSRPSCGEIKELAREPGGPSWWAPSPSRSPSTSPPCSRRRGHQARGAERQVPRAGGRDRGPGRTLRRRHHRHQHGRAAAPTSSWAASPTSGRKPSWSSRRSIPRRRPPEKARPRTTRPSPEMAARLQEGAGRAAGSTPRTGAPWPSATSASWPPSPPTTRRCRPCRPWPPRTSPCGPTWTPLKALALGQGEDRQGLLPPDREPVDFLAVHPLKAERSRPPRLPGVHEGAWTSWSSSERERVVALGGLHILATERHEARRIDNQLRGRAGRQGDPGSSRFYLSLKTTSCASSAPIASAASC